MTKKLPPELELSNYEYTKDLSLKGWAWEALRRNESYRKDHQEYLTEKQKLQDKHGDGWHKTVMDYDPPMKEGESEEAWKARVIKDEGNPRPLNLSGQYARKWSLLKMHDPKKQYSGEVSFASNNMPLSIELYEDLHESIPAHVLDDGERSETIVAPHVGVVVFDLTRSFDSQVKRARALIAQRTANFKIKKLKTTKKKKTEWLRYIRVLDAINSATKFSGKELVNTFGDGNFDYADPAKSGGDLKRAAENFPKKYHSILVGYYSE